MIEVKRKEEKGDKGPDIILSFLIVGISVFAWIKLFQGYVAEYGLFYGIAEAVLGEAFKSGKSLIEAYLELTARLFVFISVFVNILFAVYILKTSGEVSFERRLKQILGVYISILLISSLLAFAVFLYLFKKIRKVF